MSNRQFRERNYHLFLINIKLRPTPSNEERYCNLLRQAFRLRQPIRIRGEECMVIKSLQEVDSRISADRQTHVIFGKFAKYTRIDGRDWFDLNTMDKADDVEIPSNVFPNLKETDYFFMPEAHRLAFVSKSGFTPNNVTKFLVSLLEQAKDMGDELDVNVITDVFPVEQIINAHEISKLSVSLSYSNDDETDSAAEVIDKLLRGSNASSFKNEMTGRIDPASALVKAFLELASNNGFAEAKVKNAGETRFKTIKTTDFPKSVYLESEDSTLLQKIASYIISIWRRK